VYPSRFYSAGSLTTSLFERYVKNDLVPRKKRGGGVWIDMDALKVPKAHHWSPVVRCYNEAGGARVLMFLPLDKQFDPVELAWRYKRNS